MIWINFVRQRLRRKHNGEITNVYNTASELYNGKLETYVNKIYDLSAAKRNKMYLNYHTDNFNIDEYDCSKGDK